MLGVGAEPLARACYRAERVPVAMPLRLRSSSAPYPLAYFPQLDIKRGMIFRKIATGKGSDDDQECWAYGRSR